MVSDLIPDTVPVPADHRSSDGNRRDQDDLESTVCSDFYSEFPGKARLQWLQDFSAGIPWEQK